jgi:peroxiredoxin
MRNRGESCMLIARKLTYVTFVSLLVTAFVSSVCLQASAGENANIAASAELIEPLQAGDRAPSFSVRTVDNAVFDFDPDKLQRPAIFISFRGGWCPYCNMHLSELKDVVPQIRDSGVDVYFLSGDRPEILHSNLKLETQEAIDGLDYVILSDADIEAAIAFGTAFMADKAYIARHDKRGTDLEGSSMRQFGVLPVPSVYVIDASGEIVFDFVEADYKVRLPADELLAVAVEVGGK